MRTDAWLSKTASNYRGNGDRRRGNRSNENKNVDNVNDGMNDTVAEEAVDTAETADAE